MSLFVPYNGNHRLCPTQQNDDINILVVIIYLITNTKGCFLFTKRQREHADTLQLKMTKTASLNALRKVCLIFQMFHSGKCQTHFCLMTKNTY